MGHMWDGMWDGGYGHMFFGGISMIIFWAAIVALVALSVRWVATGVQTNAAPPPGASTPKQILEERFARGEIDKQEFEDRKRSLGV
jgi:putative membrane protein